jgi:hypothetical protein
MAQKIKRPVNIVATSPKGTFVFPKLNEPDYGSRDYPVPNGQYVVRLRVLKSDPKVQAFIAKLEGVLAKVEQTARAKFAELKVKTRKELQEKNGESGIKANKLFSEIYDEETEEPTGEIEFKFQMPAKVITKPRDGKPSRTLTFKPIIVDARGLPIPDSKLPPIWGGTEGIVSFEYQEDGYFVEGSGMYGVKLRLLGTQILTLRSGGERNAASLGFTQQEGLSADDLEERDNSNTSDTDDSTDDNTSGEEPADKDF